MASAREKLLRSIPAVDVLLTDESLAKWAERLGRKVVVDALRDAAEAVRRDVIAGAFDAAEGRILRHEIISRAAAVLEAACRPYYRRAINASGIILHTGLGRAVLAPRAIREIRDELAGYSVLQLDTETGKRAKRDGRIEKLLCRLTGAEAATLVNNNAAATLLVLNTLGAGREVIVSRGQLVEIGGAFRLPEVFAASGARMVEVGSTNRTHPRDYINAITDETAAILRVHPSNYRIEGFTAEVDLATLVGIARENDIALVDDVGAGALVDLSRFGFSKEATLLESVAAGADVVLSSADKLIGASQGGVILAKAKYIERIRKNPLWRALRVGKLTLAVAEATLALFLDPELALREVPTLAMATRDLADVEREAERIKRALLGAEAAAGVEVIDGFSQMGSGSLPGQNLPTRVVEVTPTATSVDEVAARLRSHEVPIFARIHKDALLIDPRTLLSGDAKVVIEALVDILSAPESDIQ